MHTPELLNLYFLPLRTAFLAIREFFTAGAENIFVTGSVLVGGDAKLSIVVGDLWERKGWGKPELVFPLPSVHFEASFTLGRMASDEVEGGVGEPWSSKKRTPLSSIPPR